MSGNQAITEFGPFRLNGPERLLQREGVTVELGSRSMDVLIALVERAGEVLSRRELMTRAWSGLVVDEANLRVNVASLRKSLGDGVDGARYIVNVPGRGYSFVAPVHRVDKQSPAASTALPSTGAGQAVEIATHLLPDLPSRLIGRDSTVAELAKLVLQHRFVTIVSAGGMGKTTVAICVAHELLDEFDGDVYFVDLGSLSEASLVPNTIASALGLKVMSPDPMPSILARLAGKRALLVLDNCEHLVEKVALVAERLCKSAPHTHVLATSRETLRAQGERVHLLTPLEAPPVGGDLSTSQIMAFPAMQLFLERAEACGARETMTTDTAAIAAEICRRMDGIALAIELVAGRVSSHGIRGTAELLHTRFNLLWQGRRNALPRHQTLQAMLDWSYNLLSEFERSVLCRLSVFVGPFDMAAAQKVGGGTGQDGATVNAALTSLLDKSLLSPIAINGVDYLRILDTTRTYAALKLVDSGELHGVSRQLVEYLIEELSCDKADHPRADLKRLAFQIGNIRAALAWALAETGDYVLGVRLATLAAPLFLEMSLLVECHQWSELGLQRLGAEAGSTRHLILQEALAISAMFTRGNSDEVRASIEQGLRLAQALGDKERELGLLAGLHIFMTRIGDFEGAVEVGRRSIELSNRLDSHSGIVMSEWMLGCAFHLIGDQAGAIRHTEEGFKQAAARGVAKVEQFGYGHRTRALIVLARSLWLTGATDRAAKVARQSVAETEHTEQPVNRCIALLYSATVMIWRGDAAEAEVFVDELIQHAGQYSLGPYLTVGIALSGEVALVKGEFRVAVDRLREALSSLHAEKHHVLTSTLSRSMAEALLRCGEVEEAEAVIGAALERAEAQNRLFDMPDLLRTRALIGVASRRLGPQEVERLLLQSIELAGKQSALSLELRSSIALAEVLASRGRVAEAFARLAAVRSRFSEGSGTLDHERAQALMEEWTVHSGVST